MSRFWRLAICCILAGGFALTAKPSVSSAFLDGHSARLERLFAHLDTSVPELKRITDLWASGESLAAANALATYFSNKKFDTSLLEDLYLPENYIEHAEAALSDRFFLLDRWETVTRKPDGTLDWLDPGPRNDKERAWMLNRHGYLFLLLEAYRETGTPEYREKINELLTDWIVSNPYPDRLTFSAPWRPLEVARRVLNVWIQLFYADNIIDPETRLLVLSSILDHGDSLRHHASFWGGNHLITEKLALFTLTVAWPDFTDSADWQAYAIDRVSEQFIQQTYADGSYKELSNHYQRVVLLNAQYFIRLLAATDPEYRQREVVDRIEHMWDFFAGVMKPDGSGPLSNASDRELNATYLESVLPFFERPDWLYMISHGRQGKRPETLPSRLYPWAGQAILRSGWEREASWLYLDAGPYGSAHQHEDRLHVSVSLAGEPFLVDGGRFTYKPGAWKSYFTGPERHNLVMIDDRGSNQAPRIADKPMPVAFAAMEGMAFAAGQAHFPKQASQLLRSPTTWTRAVLMDPAGGMLIADHVITFRKVDVRTNWHFHPQVTAAYATQAIRLLNAPGNFELSLEEGTENPARGSYFSPDYNQLEPALRLTASGETDRPTTFIWRIENPAKAGPEVTILSEPGAPVLELEARSGETLSWSASIRLYPEPALLHFTQP